MRHRFWITLSLVLLWILIVIAAVLAEAFWFAAPAVSRGDGAAIEEHLTRKLREAAAGRKLGSAALVLIQGGEIVAEHGFGVANVETQAPVKPGQTLFQLASVSKAVTAWGVMKLVEEGKIGLDEPVSRHLKRWRFPAVNAYRDQVTPRHLLSHTAGLDDGLGYGGFLPGQKVQTLEESLTRAEDSTVGEPRGVAVAREPGKLLSYSGGGYTVLQLLIEEVTHQPFAGYMEEAVLRPLGMTKATYDWDVLVSQGLERDLAPSFDKDLRPTPRRRYTAQAAVALYATPRDVAQFVRAFAGKNPVLSQETLRQMLSPQPGTAGSWGLGHTLYAATEEGGYIVGHDGGTLPAWGSILRVNPATGNGMVVMISGGRGVVNRFGHDWVYWETGEITMQARRETVYRRVVPASVAILLGAMAILFRRARSGRSPLP